MTDGGGIPLGVVVSGANRTDMKQLGALLDARLITLPDGTEADGTEVDGAEVDDTDAGIGERHLCLDRGYDYAACREEAAAHGYVAHIPKRGSKTAPLPPPTDPLRHPPRRWVVEVSHSWFNRFRRLLIRWEKKAAHYEGFIALAACLIIYRKLRHARTLPG